MFAEELLKVMTFKNFLCFYFLSLLLNLINFSAETSLLEGIKKLWTHCIFSCTVRTLPNISDGALLPKKLTAKSH